MQLRGVKDAVRSRDDPLDGDGEAPCSGSRCGCRGKGQVNAQRGEQRRTPPTCAAHDGLCGDVFPMGKPHAGYPVVAHDELVDFCLVDEFYATGYSSLNKRLRCLVSIDVSLIREKRN